MEHLVYPGLKTTWTQFGHGSKIGPGDLLDSNPNDDKVTLAVIGHDSEIALRNVFPLTRRIDSLKSPRVVLADDTVSIRDYYKYRNYVSLFTSELFLDINIVSVNRVMYAGAVAYVAFLEMLAQRGSPRWRDGAIQFARHVADLSSAPRRNINSSWGSSFVVQSLDLFSNGRVDIRKTPDDIAGKLMWAMEAFVFAVDRGRLSHTVECARYLALGLRELAVIFMWQHTGTNPSGKSLDYLQPAFAKISPVCEMAFPICDIAIAAASYQYHYTDGHFRSFLPAYPDPEVVDALTNH